MHRLLDGRWFPIYPFYLNALRADKLLGEHHLAKASHQSVLHCLKHLRLGDSGESRKR